MKVQFVDRGSYVFMLNSIAPARAGDDGWSVATTSEAFASTQMREGRAAPGRGILVSWTMYFILDTPSIYRHRVPSPSPLAPSTFHESLSA